MKIYKPIILQKLGLSEKFLRKILYSRKSALGIGLIKSSIIMAMLIIKLNLWYKQIKSNVTKIITISERMAYFDY